MTTKERLHELVDRLADEQAGELLRVASGLVAPPARRPVEPPWVGAVHSGRDDLSERHDEILKAELGRPV